MFKYHYNPKKSFLVIFSLFISISSHIMASTSLMEEEKQKDKAIAMLANIVQDNKRFVEEHNEAYFHGFKDSQKPRATVIGCADSRFHTHAIDQTPDNDIFQIRSIGNQLNTPAGSVIYGVRHLKSPLLMIIGHDDCGAIKAAMMTSESQEAAMEALLGKSLELEQEIKDELKRVYIFKKGSDLDKMVVHQNIKYNIHQQVDKCLEIFYDLVAEHKLLIIGALYDFQNNEKGGHGRLAIINVRDSANANSGPSVVQEKDEFSIQPFIKEGIERTRHDVATFISKEEPLYIPQSLCKL